MSDDPVINLHRSLEELKALRDAMIQLDYAATRLKNIPLQSLLNCQVMDILREWGFCVLDYKQSSYDCTLIVLHEPTQYVLHDSKTTAVEAFLSIARFILNMQQRLWLPDPSLRFYITTYHNHLGREIGDFLNKNHRDPIHGMVRKFANAYLSYDTYKRLRMRDAEWHGLASMPVIRSSALAQYPQHDDCLILDIPAVIHANIPQDVIMFAYRKEY